MSLYRNLARIENEDKELEELEKNYRRENGEQVEDKEEDTPEVIENKKEDETWKDRYSNLRSHTDKKVNEANEKIRELENKLRVAENKPTESEVPSNIEEARAWLKKYPDLGGVLKTLMREEASFVKEELGVRVEELEQTRHELARERAFAAVVKAHPDFPDLIENSEFQAWVEAQPEEKGSIGQAIYNALYENQTDSNAAIKAIDLYKRETKKTPGTREAAAHVNKTSPTSPATNGGKKIFRESEVERMSIRDYERLEDEIDDAKREGRFEYDITGAAR